jgi:hypothetical protein
MKQAAHVALAAAFLMTLLPLAATAGGNGALEVEKPSTGPAEPDTGYRPRWADPNAAPAMPGIENDPTPFNPADVDANSDTLNNNISPIDPN